jgi:hypothetical protein
MSQSKNGGHGLEILLFVLGFGALIAAVVGAFYVGAWALPYLVFYALPFVLMSVLLAYLMKWSVVNLNSGVLTDGSFSEAFERRSVFRNLAVSVPLLAMLGYLAFGFNSERLAVVDESGKKLN